MEEKFTTRRHRDEEPIMLPERRGASKLPFAIAGIMTAVAVVFGVLYFTKPTSQDAVKNAKPSDNEAQTATPAEPATNNQITEPVAMQAVDYPRVLNGQPDNEYHNLNFYNPYGGSMYLDGNTLYIGFNESYVSTYYPDVVLSDSYVTYQSNLKTTAIDAFFGGAGQALGSNDTIFILGADGTVDYITVHDALLTDDFSSRGKISGVEGVVRFGSVGVGSKTSPVGGYMTTIAIKADGSFYDLFETAELKIH